MENLKWIAVQDRLPSSKYQFVIVAHLNTGKGKKFYRVDSAIWNNNKFMMSVVIETLMGKMWLELKEVTHWMPLPTPPKK